MNDLPPPRPNPDRRAARRFAKSRPPSSPTTGLDPNAQFLGEQSLAGGSAGAWLFSIHRLVRRLVVGRRE